MTKSYIFRINPLPAPRMTRADRWKKRPCVLAYFAWKDEIKRLAKGLKYELTPVLDIVFIVPMADSWSPKKKALMDGEPHQQRPDRDNYLKAFQDAFDADDSFVWDGRTTKIWGYEGQIHVKK